jgi:hypothetical protein
MKIHTANFLPLDPTSQYSFSRISPNVSLRLESAQNMHKTYGLSNGPYCHVCTWIAVTANLEVSVAKRKWLASASGGYGLRGNKFSPVNPCIPVLSVVEDFSGV